MKTYNISMIGINFNKADLSTREEFSLSLKEFQQRGKKLMALKSVAGIIVINTCNRTELWLSHPKTDISNIWNNFFGRFTDPSLLITKNGDEAIDYLFHLSCGFYSHIFGDDQIHVQINSALEFSRKHSLTDSFLETLFRMAVSCAKKTKTVVPLNQKDLSLAEKIVQWIGEKKLQNKNCLIIGSGKLGTRLASRLKNSQTNVWITVRRYKNKSFSTPKGVSPLPYENRYSILQDMDYIFSVTSSPHKTILLENIINTNPDSIFIDLAVPRDIDERISCLGLKIINIDELPFTNTVDIKALSQAEKIISDEITRFSVWNHNKKTIILKNLIMKKTNNTTSINLKKYYITKKHPFSSIEKLLIDHKDMLTEDYWNELAREFAPKLLEVK